MSEKVETAICQEILSIMATYHEQEASMRGVGTPGGLEHMGDVWQLLGKWSDRLKAAALPPAMTWTSEQPIKPGWYWWRYGAGGPADVHYYSFDGERLIEKDDRGELHCISDDGEWAGPLAPPLEPPQ